MTDVDYREHDQQIWEEDLDDFVPARVFDAHNHLYYPEAVSEEFKKDRPTRQVTTDLDRLETWHRLIYPSREVHSLFLGEPWFGTNVETYTAMQVADVKKDPLSRMSRLVTPSCTAAEIERDVKDHGFIGLKPYRFFSSTGDIHQCRIRDFLPEWQLEMADDLGLWISMHLARTDACADEWNLKDLERYTTRYPKARWILCHCARSFTYWPIRKAIDRLKSMPSIWYDLSAVNEMSVFVTLFKKEKIERLFFGSDLVPPNFHGKTVALGRAWACLMTDGIDQLQFIHCDGRPILSVYEQLLAMKLAAEVVGLSRDDVEAIFWRNAAREFKLQWF